MTRSQFVSNRLLLLLLLIPVLPAYGLYSDQITLVTYSLILGGILWIWKWRWWWEPIRDFATRRSRRVDGTQSLETGRLRTWYAGSDG